MIAKLFCLDILMIFNFIDVLQQNNSVSNAIQYLSIFPANRQDNIDVKNKKFIVNKILKGSSDWLKQITKVVQLGKLHYVKLSTNWHVSSPAAKKQTRQNVFPVVTGLLSIVWLEERWIVHQTDSNRSQLSKICGST